MSTSRIKQAIWEKQQADIVMHTAFAPMVATEEAIAAASKTKAPEVYTKFPESVKQEIDKLDRRLLGVVAGLSGSWVQNYSVAAPKFMESFIQTISNIDIFTRKTLRGKNINIRPPGYNILEDLVKKSVTNIGSLFGMVVAGYLANLLGERYVRLLLREIRFEVWRRFGQTDVQAKLDPTSLVPDEELRSHLQSPEFPRRPESQTEYQIEVFNMQFVRDISGKIAPSNDIRYQIVNRMNQSKGDFGGPQYSDTDRVDIYPIGIESLFLHVMRLQNEFPDLLPPVPTILIGGKAVIIDMLYDPVYGIEITKFRNGRYSAKTRSLLGMLETVVHVLQKDDAKWRFKFLYRRFIRYCVQWFVIFTLASPIANIYAFMENFLKSADTATEQSLWLFEQYTYELARASH